jgi:putative Holliday junction resolvase
VSDELRITAQGLETFDRKTGGDLLVYLSTLMDEYDVEEIVVGHPVSMSGRPNVSSRKARRLAEDISGRFGVQVTLWDERLSTEQAKRVLRGSRAGKPSVDRVAAVLILQSYLDSLPRARGDAGG